MYTHPAGIEVGDDAVQIDAETHRHTLRSHRRIGTCLAAGLLLLSTAACGGGDDGGPSRSYVLGLQVDDSGEEYRYVATGTVDIQVGDEVTFELENNGALIHDLVIVDPEGRTIASAPPTAPGRTVSVTATFDEAGFFRLNCLVDDHLTEHGMQTFVEVTDPDA